MQALELGLKPEPAHETDEQQASQQRHMQPMQCAAQIKPFRDEMNDGDHAADLLKVKIAIEDSLSHDTRPEGTVEKRLDFVRKKGGTHGAGEKERGTQPHGSVQHPD